MKQGSLVFMALFLYLGTVFSQENTARLCADGIDNDGDGMIDCDDQECANLANNGCFTCFDDGLSFADVVIEYDPACPDHNEMTNPTLALGVSDFTSVNSLSNFVSLGEGGILRLGFNNNLVINSGNDDPDLWIFEIGQAVEATMVELRPANDTTRMRLVMAGIPDVDGDGYYEFGQVAGSTSSLDIDEAFVIAYPKSALRFNAVKLQDVDDRNCAGITSGADIDAVCALSSIPLEVCNNGIDDDQDGLTDCDDPDLADDCCCLTMQFLELGPDISTCIGDTIVLDATDGFVSYLWQDGSTASTFVAFESGQYAVTVTEDNDCVFEDQVWLDFSQITSSIILEKCPGESLEYGGMTYEMEGVYMDTLMTNSACDSFVTYIVRDREEVTDFLGPDIVVCSEEVTVQSPWQETTWPDGSIQSMYTVTQSGPVIAVAQDENGCTLVDTIEVSVAPVFNVYLPTAFSPNDDGINDKFLPFFEEGQLLNYGLAIFNRWGQKVFDATGTQVVWDGKVNDKEAADGLYVWVLSIGNANCGTTATSSGDVLLIR